ncbi:MAG TPA: hypothetical protein VIJ46_04670, partial [Rhabdochlamydiaceae bacterium]
GDSYASASTIEWSEMTLDLKEFSQSAAFDSKAVDAQALSCEKDIIPEPILCNRPENESHSTIHKIVTSPAKKSQFSTSIQHKTSSQQE